MKLLQEHEVDYISGHTTDYKTLLDDHVVIRVDVVSEYKVVVDIERSAGLSVELCKWDHVKRTAFGNFRSYRWQFRPEFKMFVGENFL